jgi:hypothetical protein
MVSSFFLWTASLIFFGEETLTSSVTLSMTEEDFGDTKFDDFY